MILSINGILATPKGGFTNASILNLDAGNTLSYSGSGTLWNDLSSSGNNGTLINGVAYSSVDGGTMVLDGIDDYIACSLINFGTSDFSLSFWCKPVQTTKPDVLIGNGGYALNTAGFFYVSLRNDTATRRLEFYVTSDGGASNYKFLRADNSYNVNAWNLITLTYKAVSKDMFAYINGVKVTSTYISSGAFQTTSLQNLNPINTTGRKMSIGLYDESRGLFPFTGNIAHTFINLLAFNDAEVLQNFNATKSRFGL